MIAFIFPGQASQHEGMGKEFYEIYPSVRKIFETASNTLKIDVCKLCFEGDREALRETQNTQPLVFTVSIACLEVLKNHNVLPDMAAGHSLGEYTALVSCGSLDFPDALKLVFKRGQLMEEAGKKYPGAMAAIIGLDEKKLNEVLKDAGGSGEVCSANFNCPGQIVISGEIPAVNRAKELAEKAGAGKVVILKVGGAFHSPLMREAQEKLKGEVEKVRVRSPLIPVVENVSADYVKEPGAIKAALVKQMTNPVLWEASMKKMLDSGVTTFIEVGPGRVLSGLLRRIAPGSRVLNVEDEKSIGKTLKTIENELSAPL